MTQPPPAAPADLLAASERLERAAQQCVDAERDGHSLRIFNPMADLGADLRLILAALTAKSAECDRLRAALRPFAELDQPMWPGDRDTRSRIDFMTDGGEFDELTVHSTTLATRNEERLDADDFRRARLALHQCGYWLIA
jgi:hypothetical protein